jgi:hypothetical protein
LKHGSKYNPLVEPYLTSKQIDIAGKLLFCGEINISPTATQPLSGFETYTRDKWGVFPHPRVEYRSVATMFASPTKKIMTTGCLTKSNYIARKAGLKAEFHHVIGALLVEVDGDGDIFCRHLLAEDSGAFQDLTMRVADGRVTKGHTLHAITWGDIHAEQLDPVIGEACWGDGGVLDTLRPEFQFFHDAGDFTARNHHNIKDPHHRFKMHTLAEEDVEAGVLKVGAFLNLASRKWCQGVVVESNHDLMLQRWLRDGDYKDDPVNAVFFLECQRELYAALKRKDDNFCIFEWAVRRGMNTMAEQNTKFLRESDTFRICNDRGRGIECALHGHRGANGAKGHLSSFARMGSKANVAHTHSDAIHEGIYQAGTCSKLDLGYNRGGLSSWSHAHIGTYASGKRVLIAHQGAKWRAER